MWHHSSIRTFIYQIFCDFLRNHHFSMHSSLTQISNRLNFQIRMLKQSQNFSRKFGSSLIFMFLVFSVQILEDVLSYIFILKEIERPEIGVLQLINQSEVNMREFPLDDSDIGRDISRSNHAFTNEGKCNKFGFARVILKHNSSSLQSSSQGRDINYLNIFVFKLLRSVISLLKSSLRNATIDVIIPEFVWNFGFSNGWVIFHTLLFFRLSCIISGFSMSDKEYLSAFVLGFVHLCCCSFPPTKRMELISSKLLKKSFKWIVDVSM